MSLELGELSTVLSVDDKPLEKGIKRGHEQLRDAKGRYMKAGEQAGEAAGTAGGEGFAAKLGPLVKAGAVAAGAAAALALGYALTSALDLEAANDKLAAQLGLTAQESERLGGVAGSLYADAYGESIQEVNSAVAAVVSSIDGMADHGDLEGMTAKVLNLANAFEIDTARAAQVAGQAITSGLAMDAYQALDLLTAAMQRVPAAVREDILDAVDEYGPFMSSIGITGEKAFGLLVKGAEKGMFGIDKVGDSLKEFTIRATDMSTASKVGFDALGMSQEKMSRRLLKGGADGAKAFDEILGGLLKIKDPVAQSQAALALFGTPLEDLSVQEIPKFLASLKAAEGGLGDVRGAADEFGDTLNDNAKSKLTAFKRQTMMQLTELGGGIIGWAQQIANDPDVQDFMGKAERVLNERVIPALRSLHGWVQDKVMPVLRQIKEDAIDKVSDAFASLEQKVDDNREELETFGHAVQTVAEWIIENLLPVLYDLYTDVFARLITGIGLIIDYISFWVNAFGALKSGATGAVNWVGDKIDWLVSKANGIKKRLSFSGMFDGIKGALKSALNWVISKWNGLEFKAPGFGPFGGQTIGTPNIPLLATGGDVLRSGLAVIHQGERIVPAAQVSRMEPLKSGSAAAGMAQAIGVLRLIVTHPDGRVIKDELIDAASLRGQSVGRYLGVT